MISKQCLPSCECSEDVIKTKLMQIRFARNKLQEEAEERRVAFVKRKQPFRHLITLLQLLPLAVLVLVHETMPHFGEMYREPLRYMTLVLTIAFICMATWKRSIVDNAFEKQYAEDAAILALPDDDEDE